MCVCSYGVRFMLWATTMSMQRRYTHIMMVARVHSIPISSTLHGLANLQSILSFLFVKHVVVIAIRSITPFDAGWSGCCCCCCSGVIVTMKKKKQNKLHVHIIQDYRLIFGWNQSKCRANAHRTAGRIGSFCSFRMHHNGTSKTGIFHPANVDD